jgi:hypothetical protein
MPQGQEVLSLIQTGTKVQYRITNMHHFNPEDFPTTLVEEKVSLGKTKQLDSQAPEGRECHHPTA